MALLLGLDFGTGGVRAGVIDLAGRRTLGEREAPYSTTYSRPGWAEQSPDSWWHAAGEATRGLMRDLGSPEIAGIGVATTASTVVACKRDGTPVRPALLWMDCRAAAEAERTSHATHPVMAHSGGGDAAEWLVPKAMWLAANEPEAYAQAEILCECLDWVNFKLTGAWVGSRMNATCKWNWDSLERRFPAELYADLGVPGLEAKLPPTIVPVGGALERIGMAAALHLGLVNRPILGQGGIDAHIGMVGAGTLRPGDLLMIGGTSVVHLFQLASGRPVPGFWGPYPNALVDDLWLVEAGQVSAGSVLSWFAHDLFGLDAGGLEQLWRAADGLPVGGTGLLTLDYFMGNRTPFRDPLLRGAVVGLSLGHDRASLYRSAVESVALASANVLKRMAALDVPIGRIVSAGGYARNPLWLKATVDAIGHPVELLGDGNLSVLGAAGAAAVAAGLVPDLFAAGDAIAQPTRRIEPDPAANALYRRMLTEYLEATDLLRDLSHRLGRRQLAGTGVPGPVG